MLDTEGQWSEALANNNIRAIIRWLRKITAEGDADIEENLLTFSCWVQRTSEFAKKELLTLCFSRCQGLWMFLDRSSFTRVHVLFQRLRNLLTLAQWARQQLTSVHLWHGVGVPCVVCRDTFGSSDIRQICWSREHRALKQHIWLGRLVQWWGIMGLLPKYPEAQEVKRISQMWREMQHSHQKAHPETLGCVKGGTERWSSFIQGLVTQLDKQHGCIWTSEDCTDQCYPPPNLQALLKLVLVPHIDTMSVQAVLMYFVLDMANFLQCKDDLHRSFCHAFTIPSSFSHQIRALWMLDHGHIKASMELLLSPRAAVPLLPWQHRCIIHCLLARKQPHLALRYLQWARPAIQSTEDAKLCADVLLQNSCVSDAWALLKRSHTESDDMVVYFLQACDGFGLCTEALKYIPSRCNSEVDNENEIKNSGSRLAAMKEAGRPPCPLSARLYQTQRVKRVSPEELVRLVKDAVMEVRTPHPRISESVVVWPQHTKRKSQNREMFLSTEALRHLTPSPSPMDIVEAPEEQPAPNQCQTRENMSPSEDLNSESVSSFASASSMSPLSQGRPHVYNSTLTLQRISSFLTDGERQSREEEELDNRPLSSADVLPDCPELMLTPDGATDPISLSSLNKDIGEVMVSASTAVDDVAGHSGNDTLHSFRLNCSPQVGHSLPSICEPKVESHSFLSADFQNTENRQEIVPGLSDIADLWTSVLSQQESDNILPQIINFSEAATPDCFLGEEYYQNTCEHQQPDETPGCFTQDHSSSLLTDRNLQLQEPIFTGLGAVTQMLQMPGSSLDSSLKCNTQTTSAASETISQSHIKTQLTPEEPGAAFTSDEKKPPLLLSQTYSYSLLGLMDFTAKEKGDNKDGKQANKDEPAGWSSLGKASQGAMRSGRAQARKGKRVKRA